MAELHVVRRENRHLYEHLFDSYYRLRHDIYVEKRRWTALRKPDGREIDQFDTADAVYLFAIEGDAIVGAMRAIPTVAPTLLSAIFPQLNIGAPIERPSVYELSRIFVVPERRGEAFGPRLEAVLRAGIMEYGVSIGLTGFTIVLEAWWLPRLQDQGWRVTPLGLPEAMDDMQVLAVYIDCDEASWTTNCRECGIPGPILQWRSLDGLTRSSLPSVGRHTAAPQAR